MDEWIAQGSDPRRPEEIEQEAKIATNGGPSVAGMCCACWLLGALCFACTERWSWVLVLSPATECWSWRWAAISAGGIEPELAPTAWVPVQVLGLRSLRAEGWRPIPGLLQVQQRNVLL